MKTGLCLCLVGILLAAACTAASPAVETPTATAPPQVLLSPSPTIVWFPPTATPTFAPTPAVTPLPEAPPEKGELLFEDDFTSGKGWQTFQTSSGSTAYGNGTLSLAISSGKTSLVSSRSGAMPDSYYLEISASPSLCRGADNYGLLLRTNSDRDYYRWIITCEGSLRLERLQNGFPAVLKDWTPAVARPGADRLGVWLSGSEMKFYIDDLLQFSARDPLYTSGGIAVFARSSGENAITVNFSNLKVFRAGSQASPAGSPTP